MPEKALTFGNLEMIDEKPTSPKRTNDFFVVRRFGLALVAHYFPGAGGGGTTIGSATGGSEPFVCEPMPGSGGNELFV